MNYFPILIQLDDQTERVCKTVDDIPSGVSFKVLEINHKEEASN